MMDFVSLVKEFGNQLYASLTERKNAKDICTEPQLAKELCGHRCMPIWAPQMLDRLRHW